MIITVHNRMKVLTVLRLAVLALLVLLWFEYAPIGFEYVFGNAFLPGFKIIVALMSFGVLLYSALNCKKRLDFIYKMEEKSREH